MSIRRHDILYGRKYGTALTMDMFSPSEGANGAAVVLVVSGGWFSDHAVIDDLAGGTVPHFTRRGYTVFAVVHGSQPKYTVPEAVADMKRSVRFLRRHAPDYGVDPERIGIFGGSAGGHLSLMVGLSAGEGDPAADDPVEREPCRVRAVAALFPPTDFLNYGAPGDIALGRGILAIVRAPFDFHRFDPETNMFIPVTGEEEILAIGRDISPVTHVRSGNPPVLLLHGDADELVPIQQSEILLAKLREAGVESELIVRKGEGHGWPDMTPDFEATAGWFDAHL